MKRYTITNEMTGIMRDPILKDDIELDGLLTQFEVIFGKKARWIWLDQASEFEKSREDDRVEVLVTPEVPSWIEEELDSEGKKTGGTIIHSAIPAIYRTQIHVPNDFSYSFVDITLQTEEQLKFNKNKKRKELASDVLIYINTIIEDMPTADKITLLGRTDINIALTFLEKGSLEQSLGLITPLVLNAIFTQEMKDKIISYLNGKIEEFNAIVW